MNKVLLVDDHADIRRLMRISLGKDFEVLEAENGDRAYDLIKSEKPDLVMLDIMMPGRMDGLEVLNTVKRDPVLSKIRIIIVSARGRERDKQIAMQYGADAYFTKPFSPLQLVATIREILGGAK